MYPGLPAAPPPSPPERAARVTSATPKSATFTSPSVEHSTLLGLTSRWTTTLPSPADRVCAWCSPRSVCDATKSASGTGNGSPRAAYARSRRPRSTPSTSSSTR